MVLSFSTMLVLILTLPQLAASAQSRVEGASRRTFTEHKHEASPTESFIEYINQLSRQNALTRDDQARQALILYLIYDKRASHQKIHYVGLSHSKDLSKPLFTSLAAKLKSVRNVSQAFSGANGIHEFFTMQNPSTKEPEDIVWAGEVKLVTESAMLVNGGYRDAHSLLSTHYRLVYDGNRWQVAGTEGVTVIGRIEH